MYNILGITGKACILDPIPTKQLSDNVESMVLIITYVTNASLENAVMPALLKHAIVRPLLKKQSLNKDILSNYRPISNLSHLAKVIEKTLSHEELSLIIPNSECKIVSNQPTGRTIQKKQHSCVYIANATTAAMYNRYGKTLVLIDFSAAFDTVNHNIMIRRRQLRYGFFDKALVWLQSYLEERTQRVVIRDASSSTTRVTSGVSQGSVLGPLLFSLSPIATSLQRMDCYSITTLMTCSCTIILI